MRIAEGYIYTQAQPANIPQIVEIERLSFSEPWPAESFVNEFNDTLARYFIALQLSPEGRVTDVAAGYCGYWSIVGEAHVTNIAVHPGHRGRGVGAGLLDCMLGDILVLGHTAATLEVREDNSTAIRLYERFGFESAGIRKKYYDHGRKNALIMWKKFK